ncbi:MAG: LPS export ABC transporter periplasmic protein LptC [Coxiella endosymbiont of Haemaphysalis qinghaiensis]
MNKYVGFSLVLIVLACLTTTAFMLHTSPHCEKLPKQQLDRQPNAFMREVNYYQYNDKGNLHSHLISPFIVHFPYKNSSYFISPHYLIYTSQHVPWTISADRGKSQHGIEWIYLWGHVKIHEPTQATKIETTITTKNITIFPYHSFAQTKQSVIIVRPNSLIKATGMTVDLKKGIIHLLSHTQGVYKTNAARRPQKGYMSELMKLFSDYR